MMAKNPVCFGNGHRELGELPSLKLPGSNNGGFGAVTCFGIGKNMEKTWKNHGKTMKMHGKTMNNHRTTIGWRRASLSEEPPFG